MTSKILAFFLLVSVAVIWAMPAGEMDKEDGKCVPLPEEKVQELLKAGKMYHTHEDGCMHFEHDEHDHDTCIHLAEEKILELSKSGKKYHVHENGCVHFES